MALRGTNGCLLNRDMGYVLLLHIITMVHRMVYNSHNRDGQFSQLLEFTNKHDAGMKYMSVNAKVKIWHPLHTGYVHIDTYNGLQYLKLKTNMTPAFTLIIILYSGVMFVCNLKQLGELPICIVTIVAIQCVNITQPIFLFNEQQPVPIFDPSIYTHILYPRIMFVCNFKQLEELAISVVTIAIIQCVKIIYAISLFNEQQRVPIFDPSIYTYTLYPGVMFVCNFKHLGELAILL